MDKILRKKNAIIGLFLVFISLGGGLAAQRFFARESAKNYDLEMVRAADPILANEVKKSGPLILVNFWASWCPPCIEETPSMLKYAKTHADQIQLYMVSEDSSAKEIRDFVKAFNDVYSVNLRVIWDADRKIGQNFKVYKMPETFLFNREGKLLRQFSGSMDWSEPELHKIISAHFQN